MYSASSRSDFSTTVESMLPCALDGPGSSEDEELSDAESDAPLVSDLRSTTESYLSFSFVLFSAADAHLARIRASRSRISLSRFALKFSRVESDA